MKALPAFTIFAAFLLASGCGEEDQLRAKLKKTQAELKAVKKKLAKAEKKLRLLQPRETLPGSDSESWLQSRKGANETYAIGALKAYGSAQAIYRRRKGVYAEKYGKLYMDGQNRIRLLDESIVKANSPTAPPYSGYFFIDQNAGRNMHFEYGLSAHPHKYGKSGTISYFTDQQGMIFEKDLKGKLINELPVSPKAEGWKPIGR